MGIRLDQAVWPLWEVCTAPFPGRESLPVMNSLPCKRLELDVTSHLYHVLYQIFLSLTKFVEKYLQHLYLQISLLQRRSKNKYIDKEEEGLYLANIRGVYNGRS